MKSPSPEKSENVRDNKVSDDDGFLPRGMKIQA